MGDRISNLSHWSSAFARRRSRFREARAQILSLALSSSAQLEFAGLTRVVSNSSCVLKTKCQVLRGLLSFEGPVDNSCVPYATGGNKRVRTLLSEWSLLGPCSRLYAELFRAFKRSPRVRIWLGSLPFSGITVLPLCRRFGSILLCLACVSLIILKMGSYSPMDQLQMPLRGIPVNGWNLCTRLCFTDPDSSFRVSFGLTASVRGFHFG